MPFPNWIGKKKYWTKDLVLKRLKKIGRTLEGPLPNWNEYQDLKTGKLDWPPPKIITGYFGSMQRGWLAAGFNSTRVKLFNVKWLPWEDEYLLEHAGRDTLQKIAEHLYRSYPAVRARIGKTHNTHARANQGYYSAAELAREYNCSCHRIRTALQEGKIKGRFDRKLHRWEIDIADVWSSAAALMILKRPKRTWKTKPTDLGDYYRRYGLKRIMVNGKLTTVPSV